MSLLDKCAVYHANFQSPVEVRLVEVSIALEIIKYLRQKGFSRDYNNGLGPANLMIFVWEELLPQIRYILQRVEEGNQVSESFARSIIGIDDNT
jgi:hypothetical protein